jgi:DNA polymerase (family X)
MRVLNQEIAAILRELAALMEINGENKYRVRAYNNASRMIMRSSMDLSTMDREGRLREIPGIGEGIATTIREILENGYSPYLEEMKGELPAGILELLQIPGLGPKKAHQLFYELGIQDLNDFKRALNEDRLKKLKGFGTVSIERLKRALEEYENYRESILLFQAINLSEGIIRYLEKCSHVIRVKAVGSLRRRKELLNNLDLLIASADKKGVLDYFNKWSERERYNLNLQIVSEEQYPVALQYFTGSKEHNNRLIERAGKLGYSLDQSGLFKGKERININHESDLYHSLGLDYIIPELRENRGEITAAEKGNLPISIQESDIKGDLHLHSRFSDGGHMIEELVKKASEMGYQYIAITDHSQSLRIANGMTPERLKAQLEEIDRLQEIYDDIVILKGVEVDIKNDGSLDFSDELLSLLDLVIASIHTGFNQGKEEITERMIRAIEHPLVNIIAHPQGRILKKRKAYGLDLNRVIERAAATGTCLEINASPYRLDLDDQSVKKAIEAGVKIAINTDAHHLNELAYMTLGVAVARRGWLEKENVLNTMEIKELYEFLGRD